MGPKTKLSRELLELKYLQKGESFKEGMSRVANVLKDSPEHFEHFRSLLLTQSFLPGGRIQSSIGAARQVCSHNCFVLQTIPDSMSGIMDTATKAAHTMRLGGGVGYDFSSLRPRNSIITSLDSASSGPISFMHIFDSICYTISSAGHRRGAQMAVLRVDHPDIEEFIHAKNGTGALKNFNMSVGVTHKFMKAVEDGTPFDLVFDDRVYRTVNARNLWEMIMRSTWEYAEPGVLFIDTINERNNLHEVEYIAATNPCGEQPLPPNGACLLGSFNLTKYVDSGRFDYKGFSRDIPAAIRAMDNVIDVASYPLEEQREEARSKRRMGIGVTGVANAIEALGKPYGSPEYIRVQDRILRILRDVSYQTSTLLAKEKGSISKKYVKSIQSSWTYKQLPLHIRNDIDKYGIRNSHLISIAPTGTISLCADNVSSGIEPTFSIKQDRAVNTDDGPIVTTLVDYGVATFGTRPKTTDECTIDDHINVLLSASRWVDSAVSKTCNVGDEITFEEFKDVYLSAYRGGAKGLTTFRAAGALRGILSRNEEDSEGAACLYNPETGEKSCD